LNGDVFIAKRWALLLVAALAPFSAFADKPTIKYKPPASHDEDDRPVATLITAGVQGSDYALRIEFDRAPWGEECKNRCANTTLFLDTDDSPTTGLQLGKGAPETGADLVVNVQGTRDYRDDSAAVVLKVKVKQLPDGATSADSGEALADLDNRRDADRLTSEANTVYALIDGTSTSLPSGKTVRVIYHPPGSKALVGRAKGMLSGGSAKVEIFRKGKAEHHKKKDDN
jgi:hypothetical protein